MKLFEPERVDGTSVTIGRRVQFRLVNGERTEKVSGTYTAVYKDADDRWRQDGLGTTNRREARRHAIEIQQRIETGRSKPAPNTVTLSTLIDRYERFCSDKGLAPGSLDKYKADLDKLRRFTAQERTHTVSSSTTPGMKSKNAGRRVSSGKSTGRCPFTKLPLTRGSPNGWLTSALRPSGQGTSGISRGCPSR